MNEFLRAFAVFLEVAVLGGIILCVVYGVKLILNDYGIHTRFNKAIGMGLVMIFGIIVIFFTVHLSSFYPIIGD